MIGTTEMTNGHQTQRTGTVKTEVVLEKLDRNVVVRAYSHYLQRPPGNAPVEALAAELESHFEKKWGRSEIEVDGEKHPALIECDVCEGSSPYDPKFGDTCPFCGSTDEDDEVAELEATNEKKTTEKKAKAMKKEKAPKAAKPATVAASTAIVKQETKLAAPKRTDEGTLNAAVAEVDRLKLQGAAATWALGREIARIHKDQLWKQRKDENGAPRWKGFDPFCVHELNLAPSTAHKLADIGTHYSEQDLRTIGTQKLGLLLTVPTEDREALKKLASLGVPLRQLQEKAKDVRKKAGIRVMDKGRHGAGSVKLSGKALERKGIGAGRPRTRVSNEDLLGKKRIKAWKAPAGVKVTNPEECGRARALKDNPWCSLQLPGIDLFIRLSASAAGELEFVIEGRTPAKAAAPKK